MGKIAGYLNRLIIGNVYDLPDILEMYSTDGSVLKIKPKAVALPESTDDVCKLMQFCHQLAKKNIKIPVTVRGSGLDKTGSDLGNGLTISTEKLNGLLEFDRHDRLVRVQAGITLKELNTALSTNGLMIPIGGHEAETIGGLISNCPVDNYAGKYGGIMNYVERIEFVLPNGSIVQTDRMHGRSLKKIVAKKTLEGEVYKKIWRITHANKELIGGATINEHSSYGYPTITRVNKRSAVDLAPLLFKAQGTLGVITEVILRAVPLNSKIQRAVATFCNYDHAQKFISLTTRFKPLGIELYDLRIIKSAEETGKRLGELTRKTETGFAVLVRFDQNSKRGLKKVEAFKKTLPKNCQVLVESDKTKAVLDELDNALASFLNQVHAGERVPIVTDFYIPSKNLGGFLNDLLVMEKSLGLDLALFGSYSAQNYSLRPGFDIREKNFSKKAVAFLRASDFVIRRQGGTITGGSPEGRIKAIVTNGAMPESEKKLYAEIKNAFDEYGILNPSTKLGADTRYTLDHFRTTSSTKTVL